MLRCGEEGSSGSIGFATPIRVACGRALIRIQAILSVTKDLDSRQRSKGLYGRYSSRRKEGTRVQSEPIQLVPVCPFTLMHRKVETLPPPDRMISRAVTQCARALQHREVFLDKAEADALSNKYTVGVLLTSLLARDQYPFMRQVQIACDYVNFGAARLSGRTAPKHEDNELTINELGARIRNTVVFALGVEDRESEGGGERPSRV